MTRRALFPFAAILGQSRMKHALIWNVVNPRIGGVLLSGEKGTAKSTLVRSLAALLGDRGVVELPLNITEDRLIGSIDLQAAIQRGERRFEPGVLHRAHGQLLYIDEVNLLSDHIVNALLTVAASGVNRVEREGVSHCHPASFALIGSMNPEEGKLRPQFLDRFGLYVAVEGERTVEERMEIIRRQLLFEQDPLGFAAAWVASEETLRRQIAEASARLPEVRATDEVLRMAARISEDARCAGHRAELTLLETARAIAAMNRRRAPSLADLQEAAEYVLPHRMRALEDPPPPPPPPPSAESPSDPAQPNETPSGQDGDGAAQPPPPSGPDGRDAPDAAPEPSKPDTPDEDDVQAVGEAFAVRPWMQDAAMRAVRRGSGRRSLVRTATLQGRYVRAALPRGPVRDIAFDATLRNAALHQIHRDRQGMALAVRAADLRTKVREKRVGSTILFVVDASGSMGAHRRMTSVKGAICSLLNDAYQKRDQVGMIAFRKQSAECILNITRSVDLAQKQLEILPTGGRTPLSDGLRAAREMLRAARIRDKDCLPVLVLVTDGRANAASSGASPVEEALAHARALSMEDMQRIVIDTEQEYIRLKLAEKIARAMGAEYYRIEDLNADAIADIVSRHVHGA